MNKRFAIITSKARNLGAKAAVLPLLALSTVAAHAQTTSPFDTLLDSIDLGGATAKIVALGVLVLGICLAFKGVDIGKRAVKKV